MTPPYLSIATDIPVDLQLFEEEMQKTSQLDKPDSPIDGQQKEAFTELKWVKEQDKLADPLTRPNAEIVASQVESIKEIGKLLFPFIPETSEKIAKQFTGKIKKQDILFKKIEI